jgi:two-component system NarL family sensor kinase
MQEKFPEIITQFIASIIVGCMMVGFIIILFQLYQKKKLLQEREVEKLKADFEKELLQTQLEIQEEVLKSVSMEIHDNIGQIMLLTNINLSIVQTMDLPPEAPELIKDTKKMLSKASEDISQLSRSLNSDRITQLGVFECILIELEQLQQKKLFTVMIDDQYDETGKALEKNTQLLIFRMFQEICNNIIKHAKAKTIFFSLKRNVEGVEIIIADNGIGFIMESIKGSPLVFNGVGLRSLQSRAKLFGGELIIDSVLQKGTTITIFVPI